MLIRANIILQQKQCVKWNYSYICIKNIFSIKLMAFVAYMCECAYEGGCQSVANGKSRDN